MSIFTAEVIAIDKAFKPSRSKLGIPLKLGAVKIRMAKSTGGGPRIERFAYPLFNFQQVPLVGEHIAVIKGPSSLTNPGTMATTFFYLGPISIHGNNHLNPMPGAFDVDKAGGGAVGVASSVGATALSKLRYKPGANFKEAKDVLKLQPYEGDTILESRFGQVIRMSSTVTNSPHPDATEGIDLYEIKACADWEGGTMQSSPIMIITNGLAPVGGPATYTKESFEDDKATICMTSGQKLKRFETAQSNLGQGVDQANKSEVSQVIISSDRLVFNAKEEHVILSAKESVQIATPDWAADMNEVLSIMDEFLQAMQKITSGQSQYPTPVGGPTLANPEAGTIQALVQRMAQLKQ